VPYSKPAQENKWQNNTNTQTIININSNLR
jgi:hypothetical protein